MIEATPRTVLRVTCTREQAELVADRLLQCGASAVAEDSGETSGTDVDTDKVTATQMETVTTTRIETDTGTSRHTTEMVGLTGDVHTDQLVGLHDWLDLLSPPVSVEFPQVDPTWADAWREHATAIVAGPFLVRPPWVDPAPVLAQSGGPDRDGRFPIELVVDPGRAFGSGSHMSTRLCLELLAGSCKGGESVLDIGCGSGVLAVAALRLGAANALGLDIDPAAIVAAGGVAETNRVTDRLELSDRPLAAVVEAAPGSFDLVVANLLIPVIEELGPWIVRSMAPAATVVVGGILATQRDRALLALAPLEPFDEREGDGWLSLALRRS